MDRNRFGHICECLLFATGEPISRDAIRSAIQDELEDNFEELFNGFLVEFNRMPRGLQIIEVAAGYQMTTRAEFAGYVRRIRTIQCRTRLSRAACETLAIIAYRQPVTVPEIEQIRGVDVSGTVKNLLEKDLVTILGRKRGPGNPLLYGTTSKFLIQFGLKDLKSLPDIHEFEKLFESPQSIAELPFSEMESRISDDSRVDSDHFSGTQSG